MPSPISPVITQLYGVALPTKRRAFAVSQGQVATVQFQFLDGVGNPVNLTTAVGDDATATVKLREVITTKTRELYSVDCDIDDADTGLVSFALPTEIANNPGVYTSEFGAFTAEGDLILTNKCFAWIDRGLFGDPRYPNAGPPTYDEVRMYMRDNAPEENRLLDDFEFDLAEICHAAELGVRYWNEAQPPIGIYFDTRNYVVRDKWLTFIAGHMFQIAAHRFRRNHLPYQSGGISIDDQNKFMQYDQIGVMLVQDYREWVKAKKVQINCQMAMTSSGSPYGAAAYQVVNTGV